MSERRLAGLAAILAALSMVAGQVVLAVAQARGLAQARNDMGSAAAFAAQHPYLSGLLPLLALLTDLMALVTVVGLYRLLSPSLPIVLGSGSALGLLWVLADLLQNLLSVGTPPTDEGAVVVALVARAIWHAGRMGGGIWIASVALVSEGRLKPGLRAWSLVTGLLLAAHPFLIRRAAGWYLFELIALPIWFVWIGGALLSTGDSRSSSPTLVPDPEDARHAGRGQDRLDPFQ